MANMQFGFDQIGGKTPSVISKIKRALNFFSGGVVAFIPQLTAAFHCSSETLTTIMGITILGVNTVGIMFGEVPDSDK